jgi:hypothetical protein
MERELQELISQSFGQEMDNREIHSASVQTEGKTELPTCEEVRIAIQFMSNKEQGAEGHQQKYITF